MEKEIRKIYLRSYKDISKDWDAYMASHAPKLEKAKADLDEALKSGDKQAIAEARSVYERTAKNITINNRRFKSMSEETCAKLSNLNETALNYTNSNMPKIYTVNYNSFGQTEKIAGYNFALVNENAVKNLIKDGDLSLYKHVDVPKDIAWNEKFINSQMTQGILQGESIPEMSKRVFPELMRKTKIPDIGIMKRNQNSATRIARTMTTAAENKGRQDSFKKAQDDGVIMEREWVATSDERTRAWHTDLDGVRVGIDEPWENDFGEIMYPGDPTADPANVYNCRCSIKAHVKGFAWNKKLEEEDKSDKIAVRHTEEEQLSAIHQYQQVSHEGISQDEREAIYDYINTHEDVHETVSRGMIVQQSAIDNWIKEGEINTNGMTSWSTDGSVSMRFAEVSRNVDVEDGKRSVLIVSRDGLLESALLPRTNAYAESEVLTLFKNYEIIDYKVNDSFGSTNKSPTTTVIYVKPKKRKNK